MQRWGLPGTRPDNALASSSAAFGLRACSAGAIEHDDSKAAPHSASACQRNFI
jgi:hypothetical protein